MLRQVSNGAYLDAIRMAEKFILHVEVLFGTIDDLEWIFAGRGVKGVFLILIPILVLLCSPGSRFFFCLLFLFLCLRIFHPIQLFILLTHLSLSS